ncbi:hypothetical protein Syun_017724 [Stephania yunnanensis]|uniref:Uncharacterized protein n=1 Tax=Stephania yunnanensis TaxID=152371 RepID=A0AAP0J9T9_9MAGN
MVCYILYTMSIMIRGIVTMVMIIGKWNQSVLDVSLAYLISFCGKSTVFFSVVYNIVDKWVPRDLCCTFLDDTFDFFLRKTPCTYF